MKRESFEQLVARVSRNAFIPNSVEIGTMATKQKLSKGQRVSDLFKSSGKRGRGSRYEFDTWFAMTGTMTLDDDTEVKCGDVYILEQSEGEANEHGSVENPTVKKDFDCSVSVMISRLISTGRNRYLKVWARRTDLHGKKLPDDQILVFAREMTEEEKEEEDKSRLEAKKRKAEKEAQNGESNGDGHSEEAE